MPATPHIGGVRSRISSRSPTPAPGSAEPGRRCAHGRRRRDHAGTDGIRRREVEPDGFAGALAVFDAALRHNADHERMIEYCDRPQRGVGHARVALGQADSLDENPGEPWGRAQMIQAGLPVPRLQRRFYDSAGHFVARTDYDWSDAAGTARVIGEFDGLGKYLKYLRPGETPEDAIRREKEREGRLQDLGLVVVRWTWRDLVEGRVVPRLRAQLTAMGLADRRPA